MYSKNSTTSNSFTFHGLSILKSPQTSITCCTSSWSEVKSLRIQLSVGSECLRFNQLLQGSHDFWVPLTLILHCTLTRKYYWVYAFTESIHFFSFWTLSSYGITFALYVCFPFVNQSEVIQHLKVIYNGADYITLCFKFLPHKYKYQCLVLISYKKRWIW